MADPAVDRGYAWAVAAACFCINFLMVGMARSTSVLYVALVEQYGATRQQASLPFSIRVSLRSLAGPLIGLLGQKYGIRRVTALGAFAASLGSFLCYFAADVTWITVFWGVVHGIGFGMSTIIHMMMINQYFDKYRATAIGLAYTGDCIGTFAFPVIFEQLLENYDVKGTFLILSSILLNAVPMALLLKRPHWQRRPTRSEQKCSNATPRESEGIRNDAFLEVDKDIIPFHEDEYCEYNEAAYGSQAGSLQQSFKLKPVGSWSRDASVISGSVSSRRISALPSLRNDSLTPVYELKMDNPRQESSGSFASDAATGEAKKDDTENRMGMEHSQQETSASYMYDASRTCEIDENTDQHLENPVNMTRRRSSAISQLAHDILYKVRSASFASEVALDGYISVLPQRESEPNQTPIATQSSKQPVRYDLKTVSLPIQLNNNSDLMSVLEPSNAHFNRSLSTGVTEIYSANDDQGIVLSLKQMENTSTAVHPTQTLPAKKPSTLKLLIQTNLKPIFFLISISMAVYAYCFGVITVLIDYAGDQGIPHHKAKYLVMALSVTDLIGRLCFGQIIDRKLIRIKNYASLTMLLMGLSIVVLPFNKTFMYMLVCLGFYGFGIGGVCIMFPILVNHYMDSEEEAIAMGCLNFFAGVLTLSTAPMIGHFRDHVGSYHGAFYIFGGLVALLGIVWQFEPLILKFQNRPRRKRQDWIMVTKL